MQRNRIRLKRNKLKEKALRIAISFVVLYIASVIFAGFNIDKLEKSFLKPAASLHFENSVNLALKDTYSLLNIDSYESETLININSESLSLLKIKLTDKINKELNSTKTIFIPAGNFSGINIFEGLGFKVPVKISFIGSSRLRFEENFTSVGINQSLYTLKAYVKGELNTVSLSFDNETMFFETEIILAERIFIGEVPLT